MDSSRQDPLHRPTRVVSVRIDGLKYNAPSHATKSNKTQSSLNFLTQPIFKSKTLEDVVILSRDAAARVESLGIFQDVSVELDSISNGNQRNRGIHQDKHKDTLDVEVVIKLKERPRIFAKTGTEIGNYEGSVNASVALRNVFSTLETISLSGSYGLDTTTSLQKPSGTNYNLTYTRPILSPLHLIPSHFVSLSAYKTTHANHYASHSVGVTGVSAKYHRPIWSPRLGVLQNELGLDTNWRNIHSIASVASQEVRDAAGHTLKSSVTHSITRDTRDDTLLPKSGSLVRLKTELAAFPFVTSLSNVDWNTLRGLADTSFLKSEVTMSKSIPLSWIALPSFSFTNTFRAGFIKPLTTSVSDYNHHQTSSSQPPTTPEPPTSLPDRFQLGGPLSIRSFEMNALGPQAPRFNNTTNQFTYEQGTDAIGSNTFVAWGSSLMFPLRPAWKNKPIKFHLFSNAGCGLLDTLPTNTTTFQSVLQKMKDNASLSVGAGLAMKFSMIRVEVNYCLPIRVGERERWKKGWQWGVGMEFL